MARRRPQYPPGSTPDLMWSLKECERLAYEAVRSLTEGTSTSGVAALQKIKHTAGDAYRHGTEYKEEAS